MQGFDGIYHAWFVARRNAVHNCTFCEAIANLQEWVTERGEGLHARIGMAPVGISGKCSICINVYEVM